MADDITIALNNYDAQSSGSINGANMRQGNSFQAAEAGFITEAMFRLKHDSADGLATAYIFECDATYTPTSSTPIATSDPLDTTLIDDLVWADYTFTFDGTVELTSGARYAAIMGVSGAGQLHLALENASGFTPGNYCKALDVTIPNWTINTGFDHRFAVYGNAGGGGGGGGIIPVDVTLFESWGF